MKMSEELPLDFTLRRAEADAEEAASIQVPVYTVSRLNREVRALLEEAYPFIWVEGEVSNFHHHRSGHMYFTLKDAEAEVDAAMFRDANRRLAFTPQDGMLVRALAQVTVYEPRGRYQLVVQELRPAGVGALQQAFERLKAKLEAEGLFDPERKRPLPAFPERLGIVTAPGAAALRDICSILGRRYPAVEALLFPAAVQGEGSAEEIVQAIERANRYSETVACIDVLIVGRGGGSLEDLWAFNEEAVARAIAASKIPVICGVGHEVDFTIADFVADVRAPTPSVAAELAVPDRAELLAQVRALSQRLVRETGALWRQNRERLQAARQRGGLRRPLQRLRDAGQRADDLSIALTRAMRRRLEAVHQRHEALRARLQAGDPKAILRRGYAVAYDAEGRVLRSVEGVGVGQQVRVRLHRGALRARVEEVEVGEDADA